MLYETEYREMLSKFHVYQKYKFPRLSHTHSHSTILSVLHRNVSPGNGTDDRDERDMRKKK